MANYAENDWGFELEKTPPFLAFRALRDCAVGSVGEANVLDLSQGEPGYGFAPSVRSRQFYAFLLLLDIEFNNNRSGDHFAEYAAADLPQLEARIRRVAEENFSAGKAAELLQDLEFFLAELQRISDEQQLGFGRFEILYDIFKYAIPAGGRYPNPWGEPIVRATVANFSRHLFRLPVETEDIMLISGASHGIGTVFKALGEEGIKYLQKGDWIVMTSPVYAPYNNLMEDRGINVFSLAIDPTTGKVLEKSLQELKNFSKRIKALVLINPNNPSGFPFDRELLETLTALAEKHDALIITDEVYLQFFENAESILAVPEARKRTIHISSISKSERSTGVRFGAYLILPEAKKYISGKILADYLGEYKDIIWLLYLAKSPGGKTLGAFQHITGIPGPAQILGLCHLILGQEEGEAYVRDVRKKVEIFYETLGLPHHGNSYYGMFELTPLESTAKQQLAMEQKLFEIAERGVVLMPAYLFFSEEDRQRKNCRNFVRVSLPNLSFENTKKAAEVIREYLAE